MLQFDPKDIEINRRLKSIFFNKDVNYLLEMLKTEKDSFLRHEICYFLGQLSSPEALPKLHEIVENEEEELIVRHEAAEALGAIGEQQSLPILQKYLNDPREVIRDTVQLAVQKIQFVQTAKQNQSSKFSSIDPTPAGDANLKIFNDKSLPLWNRYEALFGIRDSQDLNQIIQVSKCLVDEEENELLKHEVAFVLGQLAGSAYHGEVVANIEGGIKNLKNHPMVRHECASALGGVLPDPKQNQVLQDFKEDQDLLVKHSCVTALQYWDE